jgi:hypothetical protein
MPNASLAPILIDLQRGWHGSATPASRRDLGIPCGIPIGVRPVAGVRVGLPGVRSVQVEHPGERSDSLVVRRSGVRLPKEDPP